MKRVWVFVLVLLINISPVLAADPLSCINNCYTNALLTEAPKSIGNGSGMIFAPCAYNCVNEFVYGEAPEIQKARDNCFEMQCLRNEALDRAQKDQCESNCNSQKSQSLMAVDEEAARYRELIPGLEVKLREEFLSQIGDEEEEEMPLGAPELTRDEDYGSIPVGGKIQYTGPQGGQPIESGIRELEIESYVRDADNLMADGRYEEAMQILQNAKKSARAEYPNSIPAIDNSLAKAIRYRELGGAYSNKRIHSEDFHLVEDAQDANDLYRTYLKERSISTETVRLDSTEKVERKLGGFFESEFSQETLGLGKVNQWWNTFSYGIVDSWKAVIGVTGDNFDKFSSGSAATQKETIAMETALKLDESGVVNINDLSQAKYEDVLEFAQNDKVIADDLWNELEIAKNSKIYDSVDIGVDEATGRYKVQVDDYDADRLRQQKQELTENPWWQELGNVNTLTGGGIGLIAEGTGYLASKSSYLAKYLGAGYLKVTGSPAQKLIQKTADPRVVVQVEAVQGLVNLAKAEPGFFGRAAQKEAMEFFVQNIDNPRFSSPQVIGALVDSGNIKVLKEIVFNSPAVTKTQRSLVLDSLRGSISDRTISLLDNFITSETDTIIKRQAIGQLDEIIMNRLKSGIPKEGALTRELLGSLGEQGQKRLLKIIDDPAVSFAQKSDWIEVMGRSGDPRALAPLVEVANKETQLVLKGRAMENIGKIGSLNDEAYAALEAGLKHPGKDNFVRQKAYEALKNSYNRGDDRALALMQKVDTQRGTSYVDRLLGPTKATAPAVQPPSIFDNRGYEQLKQAFAKQRGIDPGTDIGELIRGGQLKPGEMVRFKVVEGKAVGPGEIIR